MRRNIVGPVVLITVGVLGLMNEFTRWDFGDTWPLIPIAIGAALLIQRNTALGAPAAPAAPPQEDTSDKQVTHHG